jgi:hypothetical protein
MPVKYNLHNLHHLREKISANISEIMNLWEIF